MVGHALDYKGRSAMSYFQTENLRTLALVGHGSCGKTTLIEAMLYRSGMIPEPGTVERGNTMCDNDALEKEVQHSIRLAVAHIDTAMPDLTPVRIHVIDTPGYADYLGQDLSALDAVSSVAAVIDATKGPELLTLRMMEAAKERHLCRMIVVNKFDAPDVDLEALLEELTGQVKVLNREFLIEEVRSQRINHRTGHCRNRPAAIMRGELKAVGLCSCGNLPCLKDSSAMGEIRLYN